MKNKKLSLSLLSSFLIFSLVSCNNNEPVTSELPSEVTTSKDITPSHLEIKLENSSEALDSVSVVEEESVKLVASYLPIDAQLTFTWSVDDNEIASVEDGLVTGKKAGTTTLSVVCNEYENFSKLLFINVTDKVAQKGIGSGMTKDDPLFIGNEGSKEPIEVFFIEVQKMYADAVYIRKGNIDVLIDGGQKEDGKHVKEFLQSHMRDDRLDMVMVSHEHEDHFGGVAEALEAVNHVTTFIDFGGDAKNSYTDARDKFVSEGSKYYTAFDCVNYKNDAFKEIYLTKDFKCTILDTGRYVSNPGQKAENPESVTALFTYKDFSFFTSGDLTTEVEKQLIEREELPNVTLYKAAHHGSHGSNCQDLLNVLDPLAIGISAAITGDTKEEQLGLKGHPADAAIERMYKAPRISKNLNVYWNGVNGDMCFKSYGENNFTFEGSPTLKGYYENIDGEFIKVTGEENKKFHETKLFKSRGYDKYLPNFA